MKYKVKITDIKRVSHDVKMFVTEKPTNYRYRPGQVTGISVDKEGWRVKKRPFTFTSLNTDDYLEFVIKGYPLKMYREHTGVTEQIHNLAIGDQLLIGNPWGKFRYKNQGVFLAGGAGITPFIALFRSLSKEDRLKGNKLIYSNKTSKDILLKEELESYFDSNDIVFTLTREKNKKYEQGRIDADLIKKHVPNPVCDYYICGKWQMVQDLQKVLQKFGAGSNSIAFEK